MRKISKFIFSISFIFILIISYFNFVSYDNTEEVFNEQNETLDDYDYYILYPNNELSTKNIDDYFKYILKSEYQIKTITPKINDTWNTNLKNNLNNISYVDMKYFVNKYINILNKYKLDEDVNNAKIYGIMIDKIVINTSLKNINILKSYHKDLQIKKED